MHRSAGQSAVALRSVPKRKLSPLNAKGLGGVRQMPNRQRILSFRSGPRLS